MIRVSSIGRCRRAAVYELEGVERQRDPRLELRAAMGTAIHEQLPRIWDVLAEYILDDPGALAPAARELEVSAEVDGVTLRGHYDLLLAATADLEVVTTDGEAVNVPPGSAVIAELKTVGGIPDAPYPNNIAQLRAYMALASTDDRRVAAGVLIYLDRASGYWRHWWIGPDDGESLRRLAAQAIEIEDAAELGVYPPRLAITSQECSTCDYHMHCWGDHYAALAQAAATVTTDDERVARALRGLLEAQEEAAIQKEVTAVRRQTILDFAADAGASKIVVPGVGTVTVSTRQGKGKPIVTVRARAFVPDAGRGPARAA